MLVVFAQRLRPRTYNFGQSADTQTRIHAIKGFTSLTGLADVTTNGTGVEKIGIGLYFPAGVYYLNDNGGFTNHTVEIACMLRPTGDTDWTNARTEIVTAATRDPFRRFVEFNGLTPDQYDVAVFISNVLPTGTRTREELRIPSTEKHSPAHRLQIR